MLAERNLLCRAFLRNFFVGVGQGMERAIKAAVLAVSEECGWLFCRSEIGVVGNLKIFEL